MKIGFSTVTLYRDDFETCFKKISNSLYQTIEINAETLPWATPHIHQNTTDKDLNDILILSKKYKLDIAAIGAHINISQTKLEIFYDSVKKISNYGLTKNIKIAIEPIVGHVFHTYLDFEDIWKSLGEENIWVNYDPSHYEAQKIDLNESIDFLGEKIVNVHMKDAMGTFPYFQFPPLGKGNIDFKNIINKLKRINYNSTLCVEYEAQVFGWELNEKEILDSSYKFINNVI